MTAAKKTWILRDRWKTHKYIESRRSQIATTVHEKAQNNRSRQGGSRVSHGPWRKNRNLQVRFHPHVVWSWLARTDNHGFLAPCVWNTKKSTSNHMNPERYPTNHREVYRLFRRFTLTHTHTPAHEKIENEKRRSIVTCTVCRIMYIPIYTVYTLCISSGFRMSYNLSYLIGTNDLNSARQETLKSDMAALAAMEEQLETTRRQRRQRIAGLLARARNFTGQLCSAWLVRNTVWFTSTR